MPPAGARATVKVIYDDPPQRRECAGGQRPCPFAVCRYHLGTVVNRRKGLGFAVDERGDFVVHFPTTDSCALDVADRGSSTLEEIASAWGVTRERIRQVEEAALNHLDDKPGIDVESLHALAAARG